MNLNIVITWINPQNIFKIRNAEAGDLKSRTKYDRENPHLSEKTNLGKRKAEKLRSKALEFIVFLSNH